MQVLTSGLNLFIQLQFNDHHTSPSYPIKLNWLLRKKGIPQEGTDESFPHIENSNRLSLMAIYETT